MSIGDVGLQVGAAARNVSLAGLRWQIFFLCGLGHLIAEARGRASWKTSVQTIDGAVAAELSSVSSVPSSLASSLIGRSSITTLSWGEGPTMTGRLGRSSGVG